MYISHILFDFYLDFLAYFYFLALNVNLRSDTGKLCSVVSSMTCKVDLGQAYVVLGLKCEK